MLEPLKVFASMRFPGGKPLKEASELKERLAGLGINLLIVRVAAGDSIHEAVFDESMAKCVAFAFQPIIGCLHMSAWVIVLETCSISLALRQPDEEIRLYRAN